MSWPNCWAACQRPVPRAGMSGPTASPTAGGAAGPARWREGRRLLRLLTDPLHDLLIVSINCPANEMVNVLVNADRLFGVRENAAKFDEKVGIHFHGRSAWTVFRHNGRRF